MAKQKKELRKMLSPRQKGELLAIYNDYMYSVRQYENLLLTAPAQSLAAFHMESLTQTHKLSFPWLVDFTTAAEKKEFQDFAAEKIHTAGNRAYVLLSHTNQAEDIDANFTYVPEGFLLNITNMPLPSRVERYGIIYPENAKMGNTELLIDGRFKARFIRKQNAEQLMCDGLNDAAIASEFRIFINIVEILCKDIGMPRKKFENVLNMYATEVVRTYENTILEILGSFAEKMQGICRDIYKEDSGEKALQKAEQDGLIPSAKDFKGYVNIRHLIRHSSDMMEELGYFNPDEAQKASEERAEYLRSYTALCDKSLIARMESYVDVLYQMQEVIRTINPSALIRGKSESNSKFINRIKAYHKRYPERKVVVEISHPISGDKYKSLNRCIRKVLPQAQIIDDFKHKDERFNNLEDDYQLRSWFLQTYHSFECRMMTYCMTRGQNLKNRDAWAYLKTLKLLSTQESQTWKDYTDLRNALSHNYFSRELRQKLRETEAPYIKHLNDLEEKLMAVYPDVRWVQKGIYEYKHKDGSIVTLDFNKRDISYRNELSPTSQFKVKGKIDLTEKDVEARLKNQQKAHPQKETYANGVELRTDDNKLTYIKLPSGVTINFEKQRIIWDKNVLLHTNADSFNVLQTANNKIITDKNFRVTVYWEKNYRRPLGAGDVCMMDYRHRASVDSIGRLREFNFKNDKGEIIKTGFRQAKTGAEMLFADGTRITWQGQSMVLEHSGKKLTYENRQEFAASYISTSGGLPPLNKSGNGR